MLSSKEEKILAALESHASSRDVEIATIEIIGSRKSPIVRVYIDTNDGVTFQDLTDAQEWIGSVLDDMDPFPGAYTMEVSSPGIDRPLRTPEHFRRFEGEDAKVCLVSPVDGRSNLNGQISNVDDEGVCILVDGKPFRAEYSNIKRANLVGKVEF